MSRPPPVVGPERGEKSKDPGFGGMEQGPTRGCRRRRGCWQQVVVDRRPPENVRPVEKVRRVFPAGCRSSGDGGQPGVSGRAVGIPGHPRAKRPTLQRSSSTNTVQEAKRSRTRRAWQPRCCCCWAADRSTTFPFLLLDSPPRPDEEGRQLNLHAASPDEPAARGFARRLPRPSSRCRGRPQEYNSHKQLDNCHPREASSR